MVEGHKPTSNSHPSDRLVAARSARAIAEMSEANYREIWEMVEGVGFEPTYAKRPDLQSGGFNHSPTPPSRSIYHAGTCRAKRDALYSVAVGELQPPILAGCPSL